MFKRINILLCFLLFIAVDLATAQNNFEIFTPEFIPANGNFEISIITSKRFSNAESLELFLAPEISLSITKARLLIQNQITSLPVKTEFNKTLNENLREISIDLTDSTKISETDFFQIIISVNSSSSNKNELKFYGEFKNDDKVLGYLINSEISNNEIADYVYDLHFDYYQKYPIAGKSLSISQGYYLNIPLLQNFEETLAVEFWIKISNPVSTFLEITNSETNKIEYNISVNENQLLVISSVNNELSPFKSFFLSKDAWYHFKILFNKTNSEISFFCDGSELSRFKDFNGKDFENLVLHFDNEKQNSEYFLEQFRLINLREDNSSIERNKNYQKHIDTSSSVILQINFSESGLNKLLNKKSVFYEKIKLVKSDAPIFPRAPEINIKISDNFYEVEWEGGSYKDAFKYILERGVGDDDFITVGEQVANNSDDIKYSLISEKIDQQEIIYFRIRQINKDGSFIYSDVVKVGQGNMEDVIIGQNFPNPFNPTTSIEIELIQDSEVEVKVYNLTGKEIAVLHEGFLSKGVHQFEFDGSGLSSGLYFYQITTSLTSQTRKMILAK